MFRFGVGDLIRCVVDQAMREKDNELDFRRTHALDINVTLRLDYGNDFHRMEEAGFLFQRPFMGLKGPTHTFVREKGGWKFLTSHEFCWDEAVERVVNGLYFDMAAELIKEIGNPKLSPHDLEDEATFGYAPLYTWVNANIVKDPADPSHYRMKFQL